MTDILQKSTGELARSAVPQNLKFEHEDWTVFRTVEGLQQKAGVPAKRLRRLVLKELADNGLDLGAHVNVGTLDGGGYFVEDDGAGIEGTPGEIARRFSIARFEPEVDDLDLASTARLRRLLKGLVDHGSVGVGVVHAEDRHPAGILERLRETFLLDVDDASRTRCETTSASASSARLASRTKLPRPSPRSRSRAACALKLAGANGSRRRFEK